MALTDELVDPTTTEVVASTSNAATRTGRVHFASVALDLADGADPLAWMATHATADPTGARQYWEQPEIDLAIAGIGVASEITVAGDTNRFASAASEVHDLADRVRGPGMPLLLGGFAFGPTLPGDSIWAPFGPACLVMPGASLQRAGRRSRLTVTVAVRPDADPHDVAAKLDQLVNRYAEPGRSLEPTTRPADADAATLAPTLGDRDRYRRAVATAVDDIRAGRLGKVVVARSVDLDRRPAIEPLLDTLRTSYPSCGTFLFERGGLGFVGATPERLVAVDDRGLRTAALAASAPRDPNPAIDAALGHALLSSPKERAEHDFVVQAIRSALQSAGVEIEPVGKPEVVKLAAIQHLYTPIRGVLPAGVGVLEIAGALHPTPAVSGVPDDVAARWLRDHEGLDRGWYASPIGWLDLSGRGELRVALRSGLVHEAGTTLYVGAGVVSGSDPERELTETDIKLRAMLAPVLAVA